MLLLASSRLGRTERVGFAVKALIATTFVAHGLYALGFYPVPGNFVDMTIFTLGVSETVARQLLFAAGVLDILAAVALFWPPTQSVACWYMIAWGLATALARVLAAFSPEAIGASLHQTLYLTIYRLPHGLLPLALLLSYAKPVARLIPHAPFQRSQATRLQKA